MHINVAYALWIEVKFIFGFVKLKMTLPIKLKCTWGWCLSVEVGGGGEGIRPVQYLESDAGHAEDDTAPPTPTCS